MANEGYLFGSIYEAAGVGEDAYESANDENQPPPQPDNGVAVKSGPAASMAADCYLIPFLRCLADEDQNPTCWKNAKTGLHAKHNKLDAFNHIAEQLQLIREVTYVDSDENVKFVEGLDWAPLKLTGKRLQTKWSELKKAHKDSTTEGEGGTGLSDDEACGDKAQLIQDAIRIEEASEKMKQAGAKVNPEDRQMAQVLTDAAAGKDVDEYLLADVQDRHRRRYASAVRATTRKERRAMGDFSEDDDSDSTTSGKSIAKRRRHRVNYRSDPETDRLMTGMESMLEFMQRKPDTSAADKLAADQLQLQRDEFEHRKAEATLAAIHAREMEKEQMAFRREQAERDAKAAADNLQLQTAVMKMASEMAKAMASFKK